MLKFQFMAYGRLAGPSTHVALRSGVVGAGERNGPVGAHDRVDQQRRQRPLAELELRPEVSAGRVDAARDGAVLLGGSGGQAFVHGGEREAGADDRSYCERPGQSDARLEVVPILGVQLSRGG